MRRVLLLAAMLLGSGCSGPAPHPAPTPDLTKAACDAATAFAEHEIAQYKGRLVFSTDGASTGLPETFGPDTLSHYGWADATTGKPIARPPDALIMALHKIESQSAVTACPTLRAMLDAHHIGHDAKAVADAQKTDLAVISLSMPAASETEAMLATATHSGPLYSDGSLFYLRRDAKGIWRVTGISPLWIT